MHHSLCVGALVELRAFKWPRRPTGIARPQYLGQDVHGIWLGVRRGDPFWTADGKQGGIFVQSLVKVIPTQAYWTACFQDIEPCIDVDIVYPVTWSGSVVEEVDLELDVLRNTDGRVWIRDQDKFEKVRSTMNLPDEIADQAESTCTMIAGLVEEEVEPFGKVGIDWLLRFLGM